MSTQVDPTYNTLLGALEKTPRQSPSMLAKETGLDYQKVKTTLRALAHFLLVETPSRGVYLITDKGRRHLHSHDCGGMK